MKSWEPSSWRKCTAEQQAIYEDEAEVQEVIGQIARLPPLVTSWEVESLKKHLAAAAAGEKFVLQGGDCAESFDACEPDRITAQLKILLQMSLVLVHATHKPVVRIGRIAGQYAKPRSSDLETRDGVTLPTYRGDLVNRSGFTREDRSPDPRLMLRGYERAALTLNLIRALSSAGFADLHHADHWDLSFVQQSRYRNKYVRMVQTIRDSLRFMEAFADVELNEMNRVDFYTSHEGLALAYEQAQTRMVPRREGWYNLATHLPWIGMRTADLDGAHVEYFRGIRNPIGIKVGPGMSASWLAGLLQALDPDDEPGRITLIHRFGADKVADCLPPLIEAVREARKTVTWLADPMHGNTETTRAGIKTRRFDNIASELEQAFQIHAACGSILGGLHLEMTGENVTECVGGACGVREEDLDRAYQSKVDPRLNADQALEMAMLVALVGPHAARSKTRFTGATRPFPRLADLRESVCAHRTSVGLVCASRASRCRPRDASRLAVRTKSRARQHTS